MSEPRKVRINCGRCGRVFWTPELPDELAGEYWDLCDPCTKNLDERAKAWAGGEHHG